MLGSFIAISATVALIALIDFIPRAILKTKRVTTVQKSRSRIPPYLIMPTVYGDISYLKNIDFLKKYASRVVICTSKYESATFYSQLRSICRQYGFRYITADLPIVRGRPVKNAYTIYTGIFQNLKNLKVNIDTPCLLIDADTYSKDNVNNLIRTFVQKQYHISSLRCEAAKPETTIEALQAFEYKLAMDNRAMDPWLTSGACNIAQAGVYRRIFKQHSNYFAGGDIEIGKIASVMGYVVGYIPFTFYTQVPDKLLDWYNQRVIWYAGGFRHHVTNIGSFGWYHFFMLFYNSAIVYLLLPLRWLEVLNYPATLILMLLISWLYTFVLVAGISWRKEYLLLPFYSFFQTMFVIPRAAVKYFKLAWDQKSFGRLRYDLSVKQRRTRMLFTSLNVASAVIVIGFVITFSAIRIDYWANNQNGYLTQVITKIAAQ